MVWEYNTKEQVMGWMEVENIKKLREFKRLGIWGKIPTYWKFTAMNLYQRCYMSRLFGKPQRGILSHKLNIAIVINYYMQLGNL